MADGDGPGPRNAHPDLGTLAGGVAVITGGASGIGFGLAERAIAGGLHPVLADIEGPAIVEAEARLADAASAAGVEVFGHPVDVSSEAEVLALEAAVAERFPDRPVSLLCCNAGVGGGGPIVTARDIDWDFVLGVNVKGVANCVRAFVPKMLEGGSPGSVVATSSQDGLCAAQGVYGVSKHACVALCEALFQELAGRLTVHVLCPNVVATNIVTSERNRPERFGGLATTDRRACQPGGGALQGVRHAAVALCGTGVRRDPHGHVLCHGGIRGRSRVRPPGGRDPDEGDLGGRSAVPPPQ